MEKRIVDLHVHSNASDGTFTPAEVVLEAKKAGLSAIALTDHDTVAGIPQAMEAADRLQIELIPGIELSTSYYEKEVHVVGLFVDIHNPKLLAETAAFRDCREHRNEKMVEALHNEGFDITMEALRAENPDCVITRANIARFLYDHGMIKSIQDAFDRYIGDGCKCYVSRFKVTPMDAVRLIKEAGGIAILAHPLLYHMSSVRLQELIDDLKAVGLDGIEAIYSSYSAGDEILVKRIARENQLLISGGSDFHGTNKPYIRLGTGRGHLHISYTVLENIKKRLTK